MLKHLCGCLGVNTRPQESYLIQYEQAKIISHWAILQSLTDGIFADWCISVIRGRSAFRDGLYT